MKNAYKICLDSSFKISFCDKHKHNEIKVSQKFVTWQEKSFIGMFLKPECQFDTLRFTLEIFPLIRTSKNI